MHIHITGAPGAGKTTIGRATSKHWGMTHVDADNYIWNVSDPPYTHKIVETDRLKSLTSELRKHRS